MLVRCFLTMLVALGVCSADTLTLRNGTTVQGTYVGGDSRQVKILVNDAVRSFAIGEVKSLEFGEPATSTTGQTLPPAAAAPPPEPAAAPVPAPAAAAATTAAATTAAATTASADRPAQPVSILRPERVSVSAPSAGTPRNIEIPGGTQIVIRMIDDVDSERDKVGQTFKASLDEPLMMNGETVVPRGADVVAKLVDEKQSGKLTGRTELTLDLVTMTVNGRSVDLVTQEVVQQSSSRTGQTAKVAGGTAALGAIIGGIAGGGRGAAIGAAAGAGAGGAVQVITKGQRVKVPSETRLSFTLQQPVKI